MRAKSRQKSIVTLGEVFCGAGLVMFVAFSTMRCLMLLRPTLYGDLQTPCKRKAPLFATTQEQSILPVRNDSFASKPAATFACIVSGRHQLCF